MFQQWKVLVVVCLSLSDHLSACLFGRMTLLYPRCTVRKLTLKNGLCTNLVDFQRDNNSVIVLSAMIVGFQLWFAFLNLANFIPYYLVVYKFYRAHTWLHKKIRVHFHILMEIAEVKFSIALSVS